MEKFALLSLLTVLLVASGCRSDENSVPEIDGVDVPAGEFLMGSDPDVDPYAGAGEMPQHPVYLDAFRISKGS